VFEDEGQPLRQVSPVELEERLAAFRRQQMSASQRRALDQELLAGLGSVARGDGSVVGPASGLRAGRCGLSGDPSSWIEGFMPDLSAGQASGVTSVVADSAPVPAAFRPPMDYTTLEMADFLSHHLGRTPSSLARMLTPGGGPPDPATLYWTRTAARLQQAIGTRLRADLEDQLLLDPSGRRAFDLGVSELARLARRPLEDEDDD